MKKILFLCFTVFSNLTILLACNHEAKCLKHNGRTYQ